MRDAKELFLKYEVERIRQLMFSRESGIVDAKNGVAKYFTDVFSSYCDELEAYEASNKLPDMYRRLAEHDRRFSDGDQSKFDEERAAILRERRGCEELVDRRRRQVERYQLMDLRTIKAVNAFMDEKGFDHDDHFRPSNVLREPRQWSPSDLNKLEAEAILWREKISTFMSQTEDTVTLDFRVYLGLILKEVGETRTYLGLAQKFDERLSQVLCQKGHYSSHKSALEVFGRNGCMTAAQFSEELAKLETTHLSQCIADEVLLRLSISRGSLTAAIDKVRREITERAGIFLCALNSLDIPPTSILREALDFATPKQPESEKENKKRKVTAKEKRFVLAIGKWWGKWHEDNSKISDDAWQHLDQLMLAGDFEFGDFAKGKTEIKRLIGVARILQDHSDGTVRWSNVISFVKKENIQNAALRRILMKRFSDTYNDYYLPLQELNNRPSIS